MLFFDNFFSSFDLIDQLHERGIFAIFILSISSFFVKVQTLCFLQLPCKYRYGHICPYSPQRDVEERPWWPIQTLNNGRKEKGEREKLRGEREMRLSLLILDLKDSKL